MRLCVLTAILRGVFETILLATDGSTEAKAAVRSTTALAQKNGSRVIVVHIADDGASLPAVQDQVVELRRAGIPARLAVVEGDGQPASAIAELARAWKADVVVSGIRGGGSAFRGSVVGGVAQRLVALAPCPVLAVPS
jgi:nucleotide-binding universal stress UspA family protein